LLFRRRVSKYLIHPFFLFLQKVDIEERYFLLNNILISCKFFKSSIEIFYYLWYISIVKNLSNFININQQI
jgi:hypothetical protein